MKAHCTACGKSFEVNMVETPQPQGGIKIEFSCTECSENYPVAYLSKRALFLRTELQREQKRNGKSRKARRLLDRYQRIYVGLAK